MYRIACCLCGAAVALSLSFRGTVAPAPADGSIERIARLHTARSVHTTTLLPSGDLLVAGGMATGGASLASAELIRLPDGRVETVAPMGTARASHTATALPDGRVVLAGGYNGAYLSSVEAWDPARNQFVALGQLTEGRSGHTATLLPDGRILLIGGVGKGWSFLASAEVFDPATGRSELTGSMSVARESHTATLLGDGRILVVGGHRGRREAMDVFVSAEIHDPATGRFEPTGPLTTPRHKHDAVRLADGRVLVVGGADRTDRRHFASTEVYDPALGRFGMGPTMTSTRYKIEGTSVLLPSGDVLVSSGARNAEVLDRATFTFRQVRGEYPAAFNFSSATALAGGGVVIVGGYGPGIRSTDGVWRYGDR